MSLFHAGAKAPTVCPRAEKSRFDSSLSLLTQRFVETLWRTSDGTLDLNLVAQELHVSKRRIYDVTNVLEGINLIKKTSKSRVEWMGSPSISGAGLELKNLIEEEEKLDELIQSCTWQIKQLCEDHHSLKFAYLTYEDVQMIPSLREQTVFVIKAPAETKLEVPHPDESLQVHLSSTQGPIEVFLCSENPVPTDGKGAPGGAGGSGPATTTTTTTTRKKPVSSTPHSILWIPTKDNANQNAGLISHPPSKLPRLSSPVRAGAEPPQKPAPVVVKPPRDEQQSFIALSPPLGLSVEGAKFILSLAEDEGITDHFSPAELDLLPVNAPLH